MKTKLILLPILIIAIILRFWNFSGRINMGADHSRDALVSFESARQLQLPLTGSFSSVGPITFGPWYYWILTLGNFILPTMYAPWLTIEVISLLTILIVYKIGEKLHGPLFGIIVTLLCVFSPHQIQVSASLTQHSLVGCFSSFSLLLLLYLLDGNKNKHIITLWGFIIGMAMNIHFQAVGLLALPFFYFLFTRKFTELPKFLLGLGISMIPILTFELNNHWFNTKNIIDYVLFGQYRVWTSNRWITFIGKFIPDFWSYTIGTPFILSFITLLFSIFVFIGTHFTKKKHITFSLITSLTFLTLVIMLRYYRGEKFFGYLQFFHPFIFIFTGSLIYGLFKKKILRPILVIFLIIYTYSLYKTIPTLYSNDPTNSITHDRVKLLQATFPKDTFSFYKCNRSDNDYPQALSLALYMKKIYSPSGKPIMIKNDSCSVTTTDILNNDLVVIDTNQLYKLGDKGIQTLTPNQVYEGMARWWFFEQP